MKKLMKLAVVAGMLGMIGAVSGAYAGTTDVGYVVIRCTATVSVEVVAGLRNSVVTYNFGDVSAGDVRTSTAAIGIRNNSQGAICNWFLNVQSITGGVTPWTLGQTAGLNRVAVMAKFSTATLTTSDFNVTADTMSATVKLYSTTNFYSSCLEYTDPDWTDIVKVLPMAYNPTASARHLWIRLDTPRAITDEAAKTITLQVMAQMAN